LSKDEIERMVQQAAEYAESDKRKRETIEARNAAESFIHDTDKHLEETYADQVPEDLKEELKTKLKDLREFIANEDNDGAAIKEQVGETQKFSLKVFDAAAKKNNEAENAAADEGDDKKKQADDADFEDVNDKKDKKD
jgi:molecular chaperone DnaK